MGFGSIFAYVWLKKNPRVSNSQRMRSGTHLIWQSFDFWAFSLSAGLLAGEGLGGVFQALLAVLKVDGGVYGIAVGCPLGEFCG